MKLKSLLMGSAAALITVSAAQAADAVVAEPEPIESVRVCDMYGAGFFYIPGTEKCLAISGELRIQYEGTTIQYEGTTNGDEASSGDGYWHVRVNLDAREETDWGTLRTYLRLEGDGDNDGDARDNWGALDAYIELSGLSTGYRTSRVELTGLPGLMHDGSYFGGGHTMYMDYTFAANGLSVMGGVSLDNETVGTGDDESLDGYIRADYAGSMFNIGAVYGHDTSESEGAWGIYANVAPVEGMSIQGYYNSQEDSTQWGDAGGDTQAWGVGASYKIMDNVKIAGGFYNRESDTTEVDGYSLGLDWNVEPNLVVRLGWNYEEKDPVGGLDRDDVTDYRVRIQSNF
ncbi:MAG: hypothetical protein GKR97_02840 [Rhizobiaceae bacterium]|nr:hypothetical protein [Rhizobiaceae bacterium]